MEQRLERRRAVTGCCGKAPTLNVRFKEITKEIQRKDLQCWWGVGGGGYSFIHQPIEQTDFQPFKMKTTHITEVLRKICCDLAPYFSHVPVWTNRLIQFTKLEDRCMQVGADVARTTRMKRGEQQQHTPCPACVRNEKYLEMTAIWKTCSRQKGRKNKSLGFRDPAVP